MKKNTVLILIGLVAIIGGIGCASISELVTPAELDRRAVDYVDEAKVADANAFEGYGNLYKVRKLANALNNAHELNQFDLAKLMDADNLQYSQLAGSVGADLKQAQVREEMMFGADGLITLLLTAGGVGTLTGLVGLMRKRPQDLTPEEVQVALGQSTAALSEKQKQMYEIVTGVQRYIETFQGNPPNGTVESLKTALSKAQSADTKRVVAQIVSQVKT